MTEAAPADGAEFVTLESGGQTFGIAILQVREIRRLSAVTPLPHAPEGVRGVINLRGAVVPIVDLAARLGLGTTTDSASTVFVVVQIDHRIVGLVVDSVSEIMSVGAGRVRDLPAGAAPGGPHCLEGFVETGESMIRVVDLHAVLPVVEGSVA